MKSICINTRLLSAQYALFFLKYHKVKHFPYIFLTASLSHHFRDGFRRGLWFAPFGNTRPLPYVLYVALTVTLPWVLMYIIWITESKKNIRKSNILNI